MTILIDSTSRVMVQGMTGREGSFHTERMIAAGTSVVAGVTPGKGGQEVCGLPIFDSVTEARAATAADVSVIFVPARAAKSALAQAAEGGVRLAVLITEGIPVRDMSEAVDDLRLDEGAVGERPFLLIGPNCPGVVSPGACNAGIMAASLFMPGPVGLVSRSGTLTYEIALSLTRAGIGQSTCVGMGGDPVHGLGFIECLELFEADPQTEVVVLVGEIGGDDEERAAEYAANHMSKPVIAYIAGFTAPPGRRMGHAGAIISGSSGTAAAKAAALEAAGVPVARRPDQAPELVAAALATESRG
jgi:succinyl-CoA synthetase alpha subunit